MYRSYATLCPGRTLYYVQVVRYTMYRSYATLCPGRTLYYVQVVRLDIEALARMAPTEEHFGPLVEHLLQIFRKV